MNPTQIRANHSQGFAVGTWGGEFHPEFGPRGGDVVVLEHWAQSGFANTDLDAQLTQRGIEKIILVGFVANTCIEGTARFGMELGYHVTLIKDATAAFDQDRHARGARDQWTALRARYSDHRGAAGSTAVLIQIEEVGHVLVAVVWSQYSVPESAESAPSVDRTPNIRRDLVYLAEWMCKFNVLVVVLRQLSAQANLI